MTLHADAVVVGAGVIGASTAYELAKAGLDVIVVEKLPGPGQGSTSASSAVIRFNYSTFPGVAASWEAMHCWAKWADHLGAEDSDRLATFHRTGKAFVEVPEAPLAHAVPLLSAAGVPHEIWDAATLVERVPGIDPGRYGPPKRLDNPEFWDEARGEIRALWTPDAGFVDDPQLAAVNLADAARRHGVRFRFKQTVIAVRRHANRVVGIDLDSGESINTPVVINVAGPWSGAMNNLAGVGADFTISTRPLRQEVHHVPAPAGFNGEALGPCFADLDLGIYFRGTPGDGLLVGGTEPACEPMEWLDDPDDADLNPTASLFEAQVTRAARRFPNLAVPGRTVGIAGVYDVADDWTPIYDRTALDGFYVAIGTSGNQFKNAPVAGRFMAAIVTACESGHDHDADPVQVVGEHTGLRIDLGAFSRKRPFNADSTYTVMG